MAVKFNIIENVVLEKQLTKEEIVTKIKKQRKSSPKKIVQQGRQKVEMLGDDQKSNITDIDELLCDTMEAIPPTETKSNSLEETLALFDTFQNTIDLTARVGDEPYAQQDYFEENMEEEEIGEFPDPSCFSDENLITSLGQKNDLKLGIAPIAPAFVFPSNWSTKDSNDYLLDPLYHSIDIMGKTMIVIGINPLKRFKTEIRICWRSNGMNKFIPIYNYQNFIEQIEKIKKKIELKVNENNNNNNNKVRFNDLEITYLRNSLIRIKYISDYIVFNKNNLDRIVLSLNIITYKITKLEDKYKNKNLNLNYKKMVQELVLRKIQNEDLDFIDLVYNYELDLKSRLWMDLFHKYRFKILKDLNSVFIFINREKLLII